MSGPNGRPITVLDLPAAALPAQGSVPKSPRHSGKNAPKSPRHSSEKKSASKAQASSDAGSSSSGKRGARHPKQHSGDISSLHSPRSKHTPASVSKLAVCVSAGTDSEQYEAMHSQLEIARLKLITQNEGMERLRGEVNRLQALTAGLRVQDEDTQKEGKDQANLDMLTGLLAAGDDSLQNMLVSFSKKRGGVEHLEKKSKHFLVKLVSCYIEGLNQHARSLRDLNELYRDLVRRHSQDTIKTQRLHSVLMFLLTQYPKLYEPLLQGLGKDWGVDTKTLERFDSANMAVRAPAEPVADTPTAESAPAQATNAESSKDDIQTSDPVPVQTEPESASATETVVSVDSVAPETDAKPAPPDQPKPVSSVGRRVRTSSIGTGKSPLEALDEVTEPDDVSAQIQALPASNEPPVESTLSGAKTTRDFGQAPAEATDPSDPAGDPSEPSKPAAEVKQEASSISPKILGLRPSSREIERPLKLPKTLGSGPILGKIARQRSEVASQCKRCQAPRVVSVPASPEAIFDVLFELEEKLDQVATRAEKAKEEEERLGFNKMLADKYAKEQAEEDSRNSSGKTKKKGTRVGGLPSKATGKNNKTKRSSDSKSPTLR